jgi:adenosine kinase
MANIGASLYCEKSFVAKHLDEFFTQPSYCYIEGFFIPAKMEICKMVHERYSKNAVFITNLNAPYIIKTCPEDITWLVEKSDIVFGNRDEFEELARVNECESLDHLLAELFSKYPRSHREKIIVITDGPNDVVYYKGDALKIVKAVIKVPEVNQEEILDTTGAGDSFVAGFLYELFRNKDVQDCMKFGIKISSQVIKTIGCNLP